MKNQKGITLVALVITIIVLLILAGVSISLVVGQNGVLSQASNAVVTNKAADVKEKVSTALASAETTYYAQWAQNTSVTRASVYENTNTTDGVKAQLEKVYNGADDSVNVGTLIGTALPATANVTIKSGSDTFEFKVFVDASTGKATIDETINVKVGGSTTATPVKLK